MANLIIHKAQRKRAKLRIGISGPAGSGKTLSSLLIASGISKKICMIDTESGRGELYGDDFDYDIIPLNAPYSPEKYIEAINLAQSSNYDVLIIDSLSHAWAGDGGILSIVDKSGNDSFTKGWRAATPKQNALVDAIIASKVHVIATMRTKIDYVVEQNSKGKMEPKKIGTTVIQRDNLEYEFTLYMSISNDGHVAHVTKDNTRLFDQEYLTPTQNMGEKLIEWLMTGKDEEEIFIEYMKDYSSKIKTINSIDVLKDVYQEALLEARRLKKPEMEKEIIAIKDARKLEIQQNLHPEAQQFVKEMEVEINETLSNQK